MAWYSAGNGNGIWRGIKPQQVPYVFEGLVRAVNERKEFRGITLGDGDKFFGSHYPAAADIVVTPNGEEMLEVIARLRTDVRAMAPHFYKGYDAEAETWDFTLWTVEALEGEFGELLEKPSRTYLVITWALRLKAWLDALVYPVLTVPVEELSTDSIGKSGGGINAEATALNECSTILGARSSVDIMAQDDLIRGNWEGMASGWEAEYEGTIPPTSSGSIRLPLHQTQLYPGARRLVSGDYFPTYIVGKQSSALTSRFDATAFQGEVVKTVLPYEIRSDAAPSLEGNFSAENDLFSRTVDGAELSDYNSHSGNWWDEANYYFKEYEEEFEFYSVPGLPQWPVLGINNDVETALSFDATAPLFRKTCPATGATALYEAFWLDLLISDATVYADLRTVLADQIEE